MVQWAVEYRSIDAEQHNVETGIEECFMLTTLWEGLLVLRALATYWELIKERYLGQEAF